MLTALFALGAACLILLGFVIALDRKAFLLQERLDRFDGSRRPG